MAQRALTDREKRVLAALVRAHVASASAVASGSLASALQGRWSAATIRNVLAALEAEGYLWQPHTSAGRMPTDRGYRFYVDNFVRRGRSVAEESDQIEMGLADAGDDLGEVLERASELLAAFARHAGVGAALARPLGLRFIRLFSADPRHAVLLVTAASGAMVTEVLELPEGVTAEDLERVATRVNTLAAGRSFEDVAGMRAQEDDPRPVAKLLRLVLAKVQEVLCEMRETRVAIHGAQYLFEQPEFQSLDSIQPLIEAFERRGAIADLLQVGPGELRVIIGSETRNESMADCSIVAANFSAGSCAIGAVGIIGPKRMRYERMIALVDAVSSVMSRALGRGEDAGR